MLCGASVFKAVFADCEKKFHNCNRTAIPFMQRPFFLLCRGGDKTELFLCVALRKKYFASRLYFIFFYLLCNGIKPLQTFINYQLKS